MSGIERGLRNPTIAVLQELAAVLGVSEMDLIQVPSEQLVVERQRSRRKALEKGVGPGIK